MERYDSEERIERLLEDFTENLTPKACRPMGLSSSEINCLSEETGDDVTSLLDTIEAISAVVRPRQPSEEFMAEVIQIAQERLEEKIPLQKIQNIIGMLVAHEDFRKSFFQDMVGACRSIGVNLTPMEIAALSNLREEVVGEFATSLDERITKFFQPGML